jgi:hypothetical protein
MEASQYLQPVVSEFISRVTRHGLSALSPTEQVVYLSWSYCGAVNNGGHASFFYNSYGEFASETVAALREAGLLEYGQVLSKVVAQFPGSAVPHEIEKRNKVLNALPGSAHRIMEQSDSQFYALGDELFFNRLFSYWRARAA